MSRSSRCGTVAGATLRDRQYPDQFRHCDYVTRPPAKIAASRRVVVVSPHPPPNVSKSAGNHYAASPGCADQRLSLGLQRKTAANRQLQICRIIWSPSSRRIAGSASGLPSSSASISRECPATSPARIAARRGVVAITDLVVVFFREINPSSRPYSPLLRPRRRSVPVSPGLSLPVLPPTIICVLLPGAS
jgi:hypothetical protein